MQISSLPPDIDEPALRRRLAAVVHEHPRHAVRDPRTGRIVGPSDYELNPELLADLDALPPPHPAAVLIPIVLRAAPTVLLTQRTEHLPKHAGQIAFPGGKVDETDSSPLETALREAEEEIGLSRAHVEPLGYLESYRTGTGFEVHPVIALVRPSFALNPNPHEVADVFEVPLSFLMDPRNHQRHARQWRGRDRMFYAMPYQDRYIWGVTAGIIKNMHERLVGP